MDASLISSWAEEKDQRFFWNRLFLHRASINLWILLSHRNVSKNIRCNCCPCFLIRVRRNWKQFDVNRWSTIIFHVQPINSIALWNCAGSEWASSNQKMLYTISLRLDTVKSIVAALNFVGILIGGYLIGHIMDSKGRKFTSVTLRGTLGLIASSCAILSYLMSSVELFAFSHLLSGIVSCGKCLLRNWNLEHFIENGYDRLRFRMCSCSFERHELSGLNNMFCFRPGRTPIKYWQFYHTVTSATSYLA